MSEQPHWLEAFEIAPDVYDEEGAIRALDAGADPNLRLRSKLGQYTTPLHKALKINSMPLLVALLAHGADPNVVESYFGTPLYFAATTKNNSALDALLLYGANPNGYESRSLTPLHGAVRARNMYAVRRLIDAGANLEGVMRTGSGTPLAEAAVLNIPPIVKMLLDAGADIYNRDMLGRTPLERAMTNEAKPIRDLFQDAMRQRETWDGIRGAWIQVNVATARHSGLGPNLSSGPAARRRRRDAPGSFWTSAAAADSDHHDSGAAEYAATAASSRPDSKPKRGLDLDGGRRRRGLHFA